MKKIVLALSILVSTSVCSFANGDFADLKNNTIESDQKMEELTDSSVKLDFYDSDKREKMDHKMQINQKDECKGRSDSKGRMHHAMAKLNLTDDQKSKMKEIRLDLMKTSKPLKDQLRELKAKHQTLSTAEKVDMKALENNIREMGKLKVEMSVLKAKSHQSVRSLLSEEQRFMFDEMKEHHGGKHKGEHGPKGSHGRMNHHIK